MTLHQVIEEMRTVFGKYNSLSKDTFIDNISEVVHAAENGNVFLFWCLGYQETFITNTGVMAASWCNSQPVRRRAYIICGSMADGFTFEEA